MDPNISKEPVQDSCSCDRTSLMSLIFWNIAKAFSVYPGLNLRRALRETQDRMAKNRHDPKNMISSDKGLHHLDCAFLAWQQLGHGQADSLHRFIKINCPEDNSKDKQRKCEEPKFNSSDSLPSKMMLGRYSSNRSMGPVITIPKQEWKALKVYNCYTSCRQKGPIPKKQDPYVDTESVRRLEQIETTNRGLRKRAQILAKREGERIELIERAENAWRNLENGYERRMQTGSEVEGDLQSQIEKLLEEHDSYKKACTDMADELKKETEIAEKEKETLLRIEEQYHMSACARSCLADEVRALDDVLADHLCKVAQMDRELQYREEQIRCKKSTLENELETTQILNYESERLLHAELTTVQSQIDAKSKMIDQFENENKSLTNEAEAITKEKDRILDDLKNFRNKSEEAQKTQLEELKVKKLMLGKCENDVIECRCKLPQDQQIEVKRTASFVMCQCSPNRKLSVHSTCSLKSSMISDLLYELFDGLQVQLDDGGARMPCQLLKCLDDKHSWDKSSNLKTNVERYFDSLIKGELDILVTTFISKYKYKWADNTCNTMCCQNTITKSCSASEDHTQRLAIQLADQILRGSTIPCCDSQSETPKVPKNRSKEKAVFHCTIKSPLKIHPVEERQTNGLRTQHKMTNWRSQIKDLKRDTTKLKEFNAMNDTIGKLVQKRSSLGLCDKTLEIKKLKSLRDIHLNNLKGHSPIKVKKFEQKKITRNIPIHRKGIPNYSNLNKTDEKQRMPKPKRYSVNMCQLENSPFQKTRQLNPKEIETVVDNKKEVNPQSTSNELPNPMNSGPILIKSFTKQTIPASDLIQDITSEQPTKPQITKLCPSQSKCFHQIPSSRSLDKFLETLKRWQYQLTESLEETNKLQTQVQMLNKLTQYSNTNVENDMNGENKSRIKIKVGKVTENVLQQIIHAESLSYDKCSNCYCETDEAFKSDKNGLEESKVSDYIGDINLEKSYYTEDMTKYDVKNTSSHPELEKDSKVKTEKFKFNMSISGQAGTECSVYDCNYKIKFLGATLSDDCDDYSKHKVKVAKPETYYRGSQSISSDSYRYGIVGDNKEYIYDDQGYWQRIINENNNYNNSTSINDLHFNELENNVYELLKDHLKNKIDSYMSKCLPISPNEKSFIVSKMLEKVKLTISESTNFFQSYACQIETNTTDSWNRVYSLLQEYIKTKLKRADFACIGEENHQIEKTILPQIIEKVCKLIDADFEKLMQKFPEGTQCQALPANLHAEKNQDRTNVFFEIPEKDGSPIKLYQKSVTHAMTSPISLSNSKFDERKKCTESTAIQAHSSIFAVNKAIEAGFKSSCKYLQTDSNLRDNCCYVVPSKHDFYGSCFNFSEKNNLQNQPSVNKLVKSTRSTKNSGVSIGQQFLKKPLTSASNIQSQALIKENEKFQKTSKFNIKCSSFLGNPSKATSFHAIFKNLKSAKSLDITQPLTTLFCDKEANAVDEENITLKVSETSLRKMDYESKIIGFDGCSQEKSLMLSTFVANEYASKAQPDNESKRVSFNLQNKNRCRSETECFKFQNDNSNCDDSDENCDCNLVPICHVKMLMKNIEENLSRSKCTCEVLSADVCPIHSKL